MMMAIPSEKDFQGEEMVYFLGKKRKIGCRQMSLMKRNISMIPAMIE